MIINMWYWDGSMEALRTETSKLYKKFNQLIFFQI
jgi:hypothetical protein